jgi:hypothetical protein
VEQAANDSTSINASIRKADFGIPFRLVVYSLEFLIPDLEGIFFWELPKTGETVSEFLRISLWAVHILNRSTE